MTLKEFKLNSSSSNIINVITSIIIIIINIISLMHVTRAYVFAHVYVYERTYVYVWYISAQAHTYTCSHRRSANTQTRLASELNLYNGTAHT